MLWVLKGTVSMRRFFLAPKTYDETDGEEKIYNFTLKIFVTLNLCTFIPRHAEPGHILFIKHFKSRSTGF